MKRKLLFAIAIASFGLLANAQTPIPNAGFENWTTSSYDNPTGFQTSNDDAVRKGGTINCVKSTDAFHGSSALKLTTTSDNFGYIANGKPDGNPQQWHGGAPISQKPTSVVGNYTSNIAFGDTALVLVNFSKAGSSIGLYMTKLTGIKASYTKFTIDITQMPLPLTPDSVMIVLVSANPFGSSQPIVGSTLTVDSITFNGLASQPTGFDGDFETWTTISSNTLKDWFVNGNNAVTRTTDAHSGTYAVEIKTTMGQNNQNVSLARGSQVSTGYYPQNCNGGCNELGGIPFTNRIDTLTFWYKYSPAGKDTAQAYISFKKNGQIIGGANLNLFASATYKYAELSFNKFNLQNQEYPDSVYITFQSSLWSDTLVSFVGSDLIVDDVHFKTTSVINNVNPILADNGVIVAPNPSNGLITINATFTISTISITNSLGELVYSSIINSDKSEINLSALPKGIYFYQLDGGIKSGKIILN